VNPRAASAVPTPCATPPPCPPGWTVAGDPWCCASPDGTQVFCASVTCPTPTPTPGPAAVPAVSGTGLLVAVLLLIAAALWRVR